MNRIAVTLLLVVVFCCNAEAFKFFVIGDYGFGGTEAQISLARQMDVQAATSEVDMIVSVGDNFYGPDGVDNDTDPNWESHWFDIYKKNASSIPDDMPWHAVLGNHDWCRNASAQFTYTSNGWKLEDFFWMETISLEETQQTLAMIYIETDLLAYGIDTQPWLMQDCSNMHSQFVELAKQNASHWSQDGHVAAVRGLLENAVKADWILVFGHHPVGGGPCGAEGRLGDLKDLFDEFPVTAYFNGHVHAMDYGITSQGTAHVTSGAGGDNLGRGCALPSDPTQIASRDLWEADQLVAFVSVTIDQPNSLHVEFVDDKGQQLFQRTITRRTIS